MAKVTVNGEEFVVVDRLGFQAGHYVVEVMTDDGERIAVSETGKGPWRWWGPKDRLQPLALAQGQKI